MENQSQFRSEAGSATGKPAVRGREGWPPLPLEHLPLPTYWPTALALAITFIFWGLITSWVIFVVGLVLFVLSLAAWIQDIRYERKHPTPSSH